MLVFVKGGGCMTGVCEIQQQLVRISRFMGSPRAIEVSEDQYPGRGRGRLKEWGGGCRRNEELRTRSTGALIDPLDESSVEPPPCGPWPPWNIFAKLPSSTCIPAGTSAGAAPAALRAENGASEMHIRLV